jgi:hypothetical protein
MTTFCRLESPVACPAWRIHHCLPTRKPLPWPNSASSPATAWTYSPRRLA